MIWGFLIQLGHNMWREKPLAGDTPEKDKEHLYAHDRNRTDVAMWNEITEYYARKGANLVLIDLGEGLAYPSHPELAVKGSWSPARMREEIARLKGLGLEPIPKLNFSACHDAWLKDYSRMVATPEYYKVCSADLAMPCRVRVTCGGTTCSSRPAKSRSTGAGRGSGATRSGLTAMNSTARCRRA